MLWRHVGERAEDLPFARHGCRSKRGITDKAGDAKVQDLGLARSCDEDVLRLEIAMDNTSFMRVRHAVGDFGDEFELLLVRQPVFICKRVQRAAVDEFHHEIRPARSAHGCHARVKDLRDTRMLESPLYLSLGL